MPEKDGVTRVYGNISGEGKKPEIYPLFPPLPDGGDLGDLIVGGAAIAILATADFRTENGISYVKDWLGRSHRKQVVYVYPMKPDGEAPLRVLIPRKSKSLLPLLVKEVDKWQGKSGNTIIY
jgi:hypothetical protein